VKVYRYIDVLAFYEDLKRTCITLVFVSTTCTDMFYFCFVTCCYLTLLLPTNRDRKMEIGRLECRVCGAHFDVAINCKYLFSSTSPSFVSPSILAA
jgi:hypothetical protein